MKPEVFKYIQSQRLCVLAIEMPDGSPHAATLHFATTADNAKFFFLTSPQYRKSEALQGREISRASIVVGVDENDMKTFQADGGVGIIKPEEIESFETIYYGKFPEKMGKFTGDLAFVFTPTWWRFTDYATPQGKVVVDSAM